MILGGYSATGPRETNEDSFYVLDFSDVHGFTGDIAAFAMVSDGMGGYQGGDVASGLAVACAQSYVQQLLEMAEGNRVDLDAAAALMEIARNAHEAIVAQAANGGSPSMGATFVGAFLSPTHAWIGHIGDSRAYLVRDGVAIQLTEDHSRVGRMLSRGIITEEEAQVHPDRNRIERALGFSDGDAEIDEVDLLPGDALLLCSDGVYTVLGAEALGMAVSRSSNAASASKRIVKKALSSGTDDNSTAVVAYNVADASAKADTLVGHRPMQEGRVETAQAMRPARTQRIKPAARPAATQRRPRTGAGARTSSDGVSWSKVAPLLVLLLLVGVLGYVLLKSRTDETMLSPETQEQQSVVPQQESPEGEASPQQAPDDTHAVQTDGEGAGTPTDAPPASDGSDGQQAPEEDKEDDASDSVQDGYTTYVVADPIELKYVDATGIAQAFTDDPIWMSEAPHIASGTSLVAKAQPESFGRYRTYQQLSDSYLDDLKADVVRFANGTNSFDSRLAKAVGGSQYLNLLGTLSTLDQSTLDATVAHLVIDSMV